MISLFENEDKVILSESEKLFGIIEPINYTLIKKQEIKMSEKECLELDIYNNSRKSEKFRYKVKRYSEDRDLNFDDVMNEIIKNPYFKLYFAEAVNRKNIYEKACLKYLQKVPLIKEAKKLSTNQKDAKYVLNKELIVGGESFRTTIQPDRSKSLDFLCIIESFGYRKEDTLSYITQKYTAEEGSMQDAQRREIISFLDHSPIERNETFYKNKRYEAVYIALLDGNFWEIRLSELKKIYDIPTKRRLFTTNEFVKAIMIGEII